MKYLTLGLSLLTFIPALAGATEIENYIECSFQEDTTEFATRQLFTDPHMRVIDGYFVIENKFLHYKIAQDEENEVFGLEVDYANQSFNKFYPFMNGEKVDIQGEIPKLNISFECDGTWETFN